MAVVIILIVYIYTVQFMYGYQPGFEQITDLLSRKRVDKETTHPVYHHGTREIHNSSTEHHKQDNVDWSNEKQPRHENNADWSNEKQPRHENNADWSNEKQPRHENNADWSNEKQPRHENTVIAYHGISEQVTSNKRRVETEGVRAEKPTHTIKVNERNETRHIAFLKVHKAGSSTIQNILYRFGLERNLTFAMSQHSHYLSQLKYHYNKIMPLPKKLGESARYDIICNHAVFNEQVFRSWMYPDAKYVAIVREPLSLFLSAAYYYRDVYPAKYIKSLDRQSFITDLITDPGRYEPRDLTMSKTLNHMTRDFGFVIRTVDDIHKVKKERFQEFIKDSSETFNLVLILEKFDESLVLLKRHFNWSLKDILYIKRNVYQAKGPTFSRDNLTSSHIQAFRRNNWMDIELYEHFKNRFDTQIRSEESFGAEVNCFKEYLNDVQQFCSKPSGFEEVFLPGSKCSGPFSVTIEECAHMLRTALDFYRMHVRRHKAMLGLD